jgi:hypothetical protein
VPTKPHDRASGRQTLLRPETVDELYRARLE